MSVEIIADIGVNHGGNFQQALDLVRCAKSCGVNAVKFQTFFRSDWPDLDYLKFSKEQWITLFAYCDTIGMPWFSTPFDLEAIAFLKECGMKIWKVPSGMVTNRPYLEAIKNAAAGGRIIASAGMTTGDERSRMATLFEGKAELLYCVSTYPALPQEINLDWIFGIFSYPAGFSDHSEGDELAIAAVARGAKIIEKHLTLDRNQSGPDHKASLDPTQFAEMVRKIRNVEIAIKPKPMSEREYAQRDIVRQRMAFR